MPVESHDIPKVMRIHLLITQYPILAPVIRERMRQEIFRRGIISPERFEDEAREKAILSQRREGLLNPLHQEPAEIWNRRVGQIRDYLTDFYFAYNLPQFRFEQIVQEVLLERSPHEEIVLSYNPELAPWDVLFRQAEEYEQLPPEEFARVQHHLQEIKVVLIKAMISDQLAFVRLAKEYLDFDDLKWIRARRIGQGKIGGKAAGIVLASKILKKTLDAQGKANVVVPDSYFIGADVFYEFLSLNDISYYVNQKYKPLEQIEREFPALQAAYLSGHFPEYVVARLRSLLAEVEGKPLIVRSSGLLEDSFDTSFAGKYESIFCPNQGTPGENLMALNTAIARVYASVANPNALLYRKQRGLLDFDERMAVLIQVVQGQRYNERFFPSVAGVAYSRNPFLWNPKLRRAEGFARLVVGLGTRAVERVGEDYPRMVALSHPQLRPESGTQQIRYYSQYYMDAINLTENRLETRRVHEVMAGDYPSLKYLASVDRGDYISPIVFNDPDVDPHSLLITFDGLLSGTTFVEQLKSTLKSLEFAYGTPVDIEFTLSLGRAAGSTRVQIHLLQCRPQSGNELEPEVSFPEGLPEQDILFATEKLVPTGRVHAARYIVYVDPWHYLERFSEGDKLQVARLIGQLNQRLEGQSFILMGPGRWGSSNPDLGLHVGYADIYNTRALVEIGLARGQTRPTLSYGTHFFQDLVKVIDVPATTGGRVLDLVMSGEQAKAMAFLTGENS